MLGILISGAASTVVASAFVVCKTAGAEFAFVFFFKRIFISSNIGLIIGINLAYLFVCEANLLFAVLMFGKIWFIISDREKIKFIFVFISLFQKITSLETPFKIAIFFV